MKSYIYTEMKRYRRKFLITVIILFVLWIIYFTANSPYIFNRIFDHEKLDVSHFSKSTQNVKVGEPFELHRNDDLGIRDYALKNSSYWKEDKYEFVVPLSSLEPLDINITNKTTGTGEESTKGVVSAKAWLADIGDKEVLVITYPDFDPQKTKEATGIFTQIPHILKYHLALSFNDPQQEICEYMLDTRGIEMESESFDIVFSAVLLGIIIFLAIKLLRQYSNHLLTPTYKQLVKYGEEEKVVLLVEKELDNARYENKKYFCENWIVSRDTFGLKIVRNHIKHGSFKY